MTSPAPIEDQDRPDFEKVLHQALSDPEFLERLQHFPDAPGVAQLRTRARDETERIMAPSAAEYNRYLAARASVPRPRRSRPAATSPGRKLLPVLGVLVPSVSSTATAVLLLLGYFLEVTMSQAELGYSLVYMGWACAAIAVATTLMGLVGLLITVLRHRSAPAGGQRAEPPAVVQARDAWLEALLQRGMFPYLHRVLREAEQHTAAAAQDPDDDSTGYSGPAYESPDYGSFEYASPDYGSFEYESPDYESPASSGSDNPPQN